MKYFEYKEKKQHGTLGFPLEYYYVTKNHPRYNMPYHWHTEFEIIRVLQGEFTLNINNKDKIIAKKGQVLFINDGFFHGGIPKDCIYECIVFDIKLLSKEDSFSYRYVKDIITKKFIIKSILPTDINELKECIERLFTAISNKNRGYELKTIGELSNLFGIILHHSVYVETNKIEKKLQDRNLQFKNILSLIEKKYKNHLSLADLSKAACMTPKYFCKFFYEMTNRTPIEYINFYRIEKACDELLNSNSSITEIALNNGFNDVSYFIKIFKRFKETTPKKYIKENKPLKH